MTLKTGAQAFEAEKQALAHLDERHADAGVMPDSGFYQPAEELFDRSPVEVIAHLRKNNICTCPREEIYPDGSDSTGE